MFAKKIKVINLDLKLIDKKYFFLFLFNKIDSVYIFFHKKFLFLFPLLLFFFKRINFMEYALTQKKKNRTRPTFLRKFLHKKVIINRNNIKKRNSTYNIQKVNILGIKLIKLLDLEIAE